MCSTRSSTRESAMSEPGRPRAWLRRGAANRNIVVGLALMAARGPGVWNVIFALSVVYTPRTAMLTRSTVLSIRELDYVHAARALGRRDLAIAVRHILPNCVGPLLVQ